MRQIRAIFSCKCGRTFTGTAEFDGSNYAAPPEIARGASDDRAWPVAKCPDCQTWQYGKEIIGSYKESCKCDTRCTSARGNKCECQCAGANHGSDY